ncbi:Piso0_000806 [Millerozyma farinosa CBS 7064]|uniref:Piso0_000806 protein n=1 Tax=Pichia sorbitophila (strain ATCC MYA-4447 / BCRC 22081 / CBS 7064 / NBRC 10061 / NRRL Y-12695) TaxID=559304 RepID=G8YQ42_PICSO|nr:Piso0_000806 [Millerozyma farinosa CBS 7064]
MSKPSNTKLAFLDIEDDSESEQMFDSISAPKAEIKVTSGKGLFKKKGFKKATVSQKRTREKFDDLDLQDDEIEKTDKMKPLRSSPKPSVSSEEKRKVLDRYIRKDGNDNSNDDNATPNAEDSNIHKIEGIDVSAVALGELEDSEDETKEYQALSHKKALKHQAFPADDDISHNKNESIFVDDGVLDISNTKSSLKENLDEVYYDMELDVKGGSPTDSEHETFSAGSESSKAVPKLKVPITLDKCLENLRISLESASSDIKTLDDEKKAIESQLEEIANKRRNLVSQLQ